MGYTLLNWIEVHWVELAGALTGLLYLIFSIRQIIFVWPLSLLSSLMYTWVFFRAGIYANMLLQGYFLVMGVYGWYFWLTGNKKESEKQPEVSLVLRKTGYFLLILLILLFPLLFLLLRQTDSPVPVADAFTTSLSILATWMMARKILEHWLLWLVVDAVSVGMYASQHLYLTAVLYAVYTLMALKGYYEWKKTIPGNSTAL